MYTAKEFLDRFRHRIYLGAFRDDVLRARSDLTIATETSAVGALADLWCPWYWRPGLDGKPMTCFFDEALAESIARSMRVCDDALINLDATRAKLIAELQVSVGSWLPESVLVARDLRTGKALILDVNKRLIALYRNWIQTGGHSSVEVVEIRGRNLENLVGDFLIVNRG